MTRRFAGFMAMLAFFAVCVSGLVTDMDMLDVLLRALCAMTVFFFIGLVVGHIANRILLNSLFGEEAADLKNPDVEAADAEQPGAETSTG